MFKNIVLKNKKKGNFGEIGEGEKEENFEGNGRGG